MKELVIRYKETLLQRRKLEAEAKQLKTLEEELKEQILQKMEEQGIKSVNYPEVGHVVVASKSHYEVRNKERFCLAILKSILKAYNEQRPLLDGIIVQLRPSSEPLKVYLEEEGVTEDSLGLALVEKAELSLRKS